MTKTWCAICGFIFGFCVCGLTVFGLSRDVINGYTLVCSGPEVMSDDAVEALATYNIWQLYGPDGKFSSLVELPSEILKQTEVVVLKTTKIENWEDLGPQVNGISLRYNGNEVGQFDAIITKDCGYHLFGEYGVIKSLSDL